MSVTLIELVEMTATLNVVVSINSTTVMQTYWIAPNIYKKNINLTEYSLGVKLVLYKKVLSGG